MSWSGLAKFLIGFFLAVAFLLGTGVATAYYFFTKLTTPPPKPMFAEEQSKLQIAKLKKSSVAKLKSRSVAQPSAATKKSDKQPPLEAGAYKARITWSEGLSLRSEPHSDSERLGEVSHNEQVVVLEESSDKKWQRVRLENSDQKGWIRSGNVERVDNQKAEGDNKAN